MFVCLETCLHNPAAPDAQYAGLELEAAAVENYTRQTLSTAAAPRKKKKKPIRKETEGC